MITYESTRAYVSKFTGALFLTQEAARQFDVAQAVMELRVAAHGASVNDIIAEPRFDTARKAIIFIADLIKERELDGWLQEFNARQQAEKIAIPAAGEELEAQLEAVEF